MEEHFLSFSRNQRGLRLVSFLEKFGTAGQATA
jgi:hypothetical protein